MFNMLKNNKLYSHSLQGAFRSGTPLKEVGRAGMLNTFFYRIATLAWRGEIQLEPSNDSKVAGPLLFWPVRSNHPEIRPSLYSEGRSSSNENIRMTNSSKNNSIEKGNHIITFLFLFLLIKWFHSQGWKNHNPLSKFNVHSLKHGNKQLAGIPSPPFR